MATPKIPPHTTSPSDADSTTWIEIEGWKIISTVLPISNAREIDDMQQALGGLPIPEMPFGNNRVVLKHISSGWEYRFETQQALAAVKLGVLGDGDGGVKVGYAKEWMQSRIDPDSETPMPKTSPTKSYDWTYTTSYPGHEVSEPPGKWISADPEDPRQTIPMTQLSRKDPILYYAELTLFEDELHDNGSSMLVIRLRVMPTCFFLLSRLTVRVDNVVFRTFDTRIFHAFAHDTHKVPLVVRETSGWEASSDAVKARLPDQNDLTPLTDAAFIANTLCNLPKSVSQNRDFPTGTGWRGLGTRVECCFLSSDGCEDAGL